MQSPPFFLQQLKAIFADRKKPMIMNPMVELIRYYDSVNAIKISDSDYFMIAFLTPECYLKIRY